MRAKRAHAPSPELDPPADRGLKQVSRRQPELLGEPTSSIGLNRTPKRPKRRLISPPRPHSAPTAGYHARRWRGREPGQEELAYKASGALPSPRGIPTMRAPSCSISERSSQPVHRSGPTRPRSPAKRLTGKHATGGHLGPGVRRRARAVCKSCAPTGFRLRNVCLVAF